MLHLVAAGLCALPCAGGVVYPFALCCLCTAGTPDAFILGDGLPCATEVSIMCHTCRTRHCSTMAVALGLTGREVICPAWCRHCIVALNHNGSDLCWVLP